MTDSINSIHELLDEKGVRHMMRDEDTLYIPYYDGNVQYHVTVKATVHLLRVMVFVPGKVLSKRRVAVAEFLTRMNGRVNIGSFQMFMNTGLVYFEFTVPLLPDMQSGEQVNRLFLFALERATGHVDLAWDLILRVGRVPVSAKHAMRVLEERIDKENRRDRVPEPLLDIESINTN